MKCIFSNICAISVYATIIMIYGHLDTDVWAGTILLVPIVLFVYLIMWLFGLFDEEIRKSETERPGDKDE